MPCKTESRMRILSLIGELPFPPNSGTGIRIWNLYRHLAKAVDLTLICRTRSQIDPYHLSRCAEENLGLQLIYVPRPSVSSKLRKGFSFLMRLQPVRTAGFYFPQVARQIAGMILKRDFDVIIIESTIMGIYWPAISNSRALKVLDLNDLHGERARREAAILPPGKDKLMCLYDALIFEHFENRLIDRADLVLTISERERSQILSKHKNTRIHLVPNGVDCDQIRPLRLEQNRELLFVGILDYLPNIDAVLFFVHNVLPSLQQKYPDVTFRVVGKNPVPQITQLRGRAGVEITGEVTDLEPYYRHCRACIVPLRAGSGSRIKILEAMAYGRPVVSTSLGCEGLEVKDHQHLLVADTPSKMIEAIDIVFSQDNAAKSMVQNSRILVEESYSWKTIAESMYVCLAELVHKSRIGQTG